MSPDASFIPCLTEYPLPQLLSFKINLSIFVVNFSFKISRVPSVEKSSITIISLSYLLSFLTLSRIIIWNIISPSRYIECKTYESELLSQTMINYALTN